MQAIAAEGITYTIDQMDSDIISRLKTPDGALVLLPYPVVTVDMRIPARDLFASL